MYIDIDIDDRSLSPITRGEQYYWGINIFAQSISINYWLINIELLNEKKILIDIDWRFTQWMNIDIYWLISPVCIQ